MATEPGVDWELSKENVQPVKRGRTAAQLQVALASTEEDVIAVERRWVREGER